MATNTSHGRSCTKIQGGSPSVSARGSTWIPKDDHLFSQQMSWNADCLADSSRFIKIHQCGFRILVALPNFRSRPVPWAAPEQLGRHGELGISHGTRRVLGVLRGGQAFPHFFYGKCLKSFANGRSTMATSTKSPGSLHPSWSLAWTDQTWFWGSYAMTRMSFDYIGKLSAGAGPLKWWMASIVFSTKIHRAFSDIAAGNSWK